MMVKFVDLQKPECGKGEIKKLPNGSQNIIYMSSSKSNNLYGGTFKVAAMSNRVSKEIALQIFGASTWPKKDVSV